jgi:hypothetical protein
LRQKKFLRIELGWSRICEARVAAAEHGIHEEDPEAARAAYAQARKAQRELFNSATGLAKRLQGFEELLKLKYQWLQIDVASKFPLPDVLAACNLLTSFATATTPHPNNLAEVKMAKSELSLTIQGHTLLWWRTYLPPYKGKWQDLHALARRWRLTDTHDLEAFQRQVRKSRPVKDASGMTHILRCPPWATPKHDHLP